MKYSRVVPDRTARSSSDHPVAAWTTPKLSTARVFLSVFSVTCAVFCGSTFLAAALTGRISLLETIVLPSAVAICLVISVLLVLAPKGWVRPAALVFKATGTAVLATGLLDGMTQEDSNLGFYLAWMPILYVAIFFTGDARMPLRHVVAVFVVVSELVIGTSVAGPLPLDHPQVLHVYSSLLAQLAVILMFHFISHQREKFAALEAQMIASEEHARLLEEEAAKARQAQERAELSDKTKSTFLANMSHELRTPLNAVIGFSELMERRALGDLPEVYASYATDIRTSGEHLLGIINDILDISRIELGQFELHEDEIILSDVAASCLRLVSIRAEAERIAVSVDVPETLPTAFADPQRVRQLVTNLLSNAIKYNRPNGQVALRAEVDPSGGIVISVRDDGIGMTPRDVELATAPFRQVESNMNRSKDGVGLGLSICKSIAEMHGGELVIESVLDQGTSVRFRLPPERVFSD